MAKAIPDGYHSVQPYLYFKNTAEAIAYYDKAFGATERMRMPDKNGRIMHAEISIGDSCIMMADENPAIDAHSPEHYGGVPMGLVIYVEDCDAVYKSALDAGATSLREPADQFYGDRTAGVADPFGFHWWIGTHVKDVSMEEMKQHM
jgi:PhnB protein